MLNEIHKLYKIANKSERLIIGLMSGTSMDGLDIALCKVKGSGTETNVEVLNFKTAEFTDSFRNNIKSIFSRRDADLQMVTLMNAEIAKVHAKLINDAIIEWGYLNEDIDLIASHGQTIFHAPKSLHQENNFPNATLQIGDGDHIAVETGIITVCDFRQKHIAAGGEGAPLAVYGDYLIFSKKGENRIMLNIGGISNFTYLPGNLNAEEVFSTDVGPGNTIMDQYMQKHFNQFFDKDAAVAQKGVSNDNLLKELLNCSFLKESFPKTTGPELFNLEYLAQAQDRSKTQNLSHEDVMATLARFTGISIAKAIQSCFTVNDVFTIYMSGGGMHNPLIVEVLKEHLFNCDFQTTAKLNVNPDAKEAVLFAVLANETISGQKIKFGEREGIPVVCMGKICLSQ